MRIEDWDGQAVCQDKETKKNMYKWLLEDSRNRKQRQKVLMINLNKEKNATKHDVASNKKALGLKCYLVSQFTFWVS